MKVDGIFTLEKANRSEIHLLLAGKFWQAWEFSAFLFTKNFFEYKINGRYVKKVGAEMLYLGFSEEGFPKVKSIIESKKIVLEQVDSKHMVIRGVTVYTGFDEWKRLQFENLKTINETEIQKDAKAPVQAKISQVSILYASKEFYECTKYIFGRTCDTAKGLRYTLCDVLRKECLELLDTFQCVQMDLNEVDRLSMARLFCRIRIKLRMLFDFKQLSTNQWLYINDKLENIKKCLRLESVCLRVGGECLSESGSPLDEKVK